MKNYKVKLFGKGIIAEHIIPFNIEPTQEQVEDAVALLINEGLMELKFEKGFHHTNRWTLTYEDVTEKKEKQLILGEWI